MINYEIREAEPLDLFLGICRKDKRPIRETETGFPLSTWADKHNSTCPECLEPVKMQRVYGIEVGMSCDERCQGATGHHCECACGGVNHGDIWSKKDEILAGALERYRSTQEKREQTRTERRTEKVAKKQAAFDEWAGEMPQKELVAYLSSDWVGDFPNPFLESLSEQLERNSTLSERQLDAGIRTMKRRLSAAKWEERRRAKAIEAAKPSENGEKKLTTEGMTLGVFRYDGDVYVCKPNRAGTHSYASKMVELTAARMNEEGDKVHYEWEYAPGMLSKLTEANRMPEEDAVALMIRYGKCFMCHHGLKAEKSVRGTRIHGIVQMVGPRCAKKLGYRRGEGVTDEEN